MHTGTNLSYVQAYNQRIVLDTVRLHGPLSRADIARQTSLTKPTVSNIVGELVARKLILEKGQQVSGGGGKRATNLVINPQGAFSIGLNLDHDRLSGVLIDFSGEIHQRVTYALDLPTLDEAVSHIDQAVEHLIAAQRLSRERLWGVGVGFPGPLHSRAGYVVGPPNLPGWKGAPVVEILTERLKLPIYLENDATAAAVGELWYGAGRSLSNFFYVYFGVGLGSGMVINGQPYEGQRGNAGEIGFVPNVLRYAYASENASHGVEHPGQFFSLPKLYRALNDQGEAVASLQDLEALYLRGSKPLLDWLDDFAKRLAPLLVTVEYLLDPKVIFLGGRLPKPLITYLIGQSQTLFPLLRVSEQPSLVELLVAEAGEDAAVLGVATLPIYRALVPDHQLLLQRRQVSSATDSASLLQPVALLARERGAP